MARPGGGTRLRGPLERVADGPEPPEHRPAEQGRESPAQHQRPRRPPNGPVPVAAAPPRGGEVVGDEGTGRAGEEDQVQPPQRVHAQFPPGERGRDDEEREGEGQGVGELAAEVHDGLELDDGAKGAAHHPGKQLARGLDTALGPAPLLYQERGRCARKFGRDTHLVQQDEAPSRHLGPVADVEVLGQRVVIPSTRVHERLSAPHPRRAVELEEPATAVSPPLFHQEVPVQKERLGAGQPRFVLVEMLPAGLNHADPGIRHRREELFEEAGLGDEIGVENEDVVACRRLETRGEGARLVAAAGGAVEDRDVDAPPPPLAGAQPGQGGGLVGGVVEDLDLEEVAGVGEAAGGVDEALDDVPLVVDGELDGDGGMGGEGGRGPPVGHRPWPP